MTYKPLEDSHIRLLELTRYDPSQGRLRGRLVHRRLSERPTYTAFSYVWGKGRHSKSILLGKNFIHYITINLFNGLKKLSSFANRVWVWVDQICINQEDEREKMCQVRLMGQIYSQAQRVVAWLGDTTSETGIGIILLRYFGSLKEGRSAVDNQHRDHERTRLYSKLAKVVWNDPLQIMEPRNVAWQAAMSFVALPWFSRLWIAQEGVLSRDLQTHCGQDTIPGDLFFDALDLVSSLLGHGDCTLLAAFNNSHKIASLRASAPPARSSSVLELSHQLRGWACEDDRDRLHAVLGMVYRDRPSPWSAPSKTMTVEELYTDYARWHISDTGSLDILHFAGDSRICVTQIDGHYVSLSSAVRAYDIPSWSPDWRISTRPTPLHLTLRQDDHFETRSGSITTDFTFDASLKKLCVRGYLVDKLLQVGPPLVEGVCNFMHPNKVFNEWFRIAKEASQGATNLHDRFAAMLIMREIRTAPQESTKPTTSDELLKNYKHWASRNLSCENRPIGVAETEWKELQQEPRRDGLTQSVRYGNEVSEACRHRAFFTTRNGKLGLGPAQMSPSSVYLIQGLKTPFLLQKAPNYQGIISAGNVMSKASLISRFENRVTRFLT